MRKTIIILFLALTLTGCSNVKTSEQPNTSSQEIAGSEIKQPPMSSVATAPEKIEVFLFHGTVRCSTCIAIGKLSERTVQEKFAEETKSGRIVFKEINIDQPENKALAEKFQAAGSALYINTIRNGQDNIEQDTKVWRLTGDETAFINYLQNKINMLMAG